MCCSMFYLAFYALFQIGLYSSSTDLFFPNYSKTMHLHLLYVYVIGHLYTLNEGCVLAYFRIVLV